MSDMEAPDLFPPDLFPPDLFPDQIICEILTRLPVKPIGRFKCVSKRWFSLISSPSFIDSYVSRSTPSWAIMDRVVQVQTGPQEDSTPCLNISLAEPPNVTTFSVSHHMVDEDLVDPCRQSFPAVIYVSSGLLLFAVARKRDPYGERERNPNFFSSRTHSDDLVLCNPITHQWLKLPNPPSLLNHRSSIGLVTRGGAVPDFVVTEYRPLIGSKSASLMTFSSQTGKWEMKSANYMLNMHFWRPGGVFEYDGHLVWIDSSRGLIVWDDPFSSEKVVKCRFIPLPKGCRRRFDAPRLEQERCVGVGGGGGIQYLEMVDDGQFLKMWRLNDYYDEQKEWSLLYKVCLMDIWVDDGLPLPTVIPELLFIHPFEDDVAFFVIGDDILSVNVEKKKVLSCGVHSSSTGKMQVFPFVIPTWITSFSPHLLALMAKESGNVCFKEKKFNEAIEYYSKSIQHSATAVAYANRAAAYLQINGYLEAENDCTEAIKLDDRYLKAYARRSIARKQLGKHSEAELDDQFWKNFDPVLIQELHAQIRSYLGKVTITQVDKEEDGM